MVRSVSDAIFCFEEEENEEPTEFGLLLILVLLSKEYLFGIYCYYCRY